MDDGALLGVDDDDLHIVECRRHADVPVGEFGVNVAVYAPAEHAVDVAADVAFVVGIDDEHHVPELAGCIFGTVNDFARVRGGATWSLIKVMVCVRPLRNERAMAFG